MKLTDDRNMLLTPLRIGEFKSEIGSLGYVIHGKGRVMMGYDNVVGYLDEEKIPMMMTFYKPYSDEAMEIRNVAEKYRIRHVGP